MVAITCEPVVRIIEVPYLYLDVILPVLNYLLKLECSEVIPKTYCVVTHNTTYSTVNL